MSLHKKCGLWYAAVYLGIKNGKQSYEWTKGYEKKEDAKLAELELKKQVCENNHKVYDKAYFSYVADAWFSSKEKTLTSITYACYKDLYGRYIKDYFTNYKIKDIEPIDVNNFMTSFDLKPATINKIMTILKQIFDFAIAMNYIRYNPCQGIKKPNIRKSKKCVWSPEEIRRFLNLDDVKQASCYTALLILFYTGMRPGEVCGLKWRDFDGECFTAQNGINKKRNETTLKNDKAHDEVYLSENLISYLKSYKVGQKAVFLEHGMKLTNDSYINCLEPDMRPMTPSYIYKAFERLIKRNNFEKIRLYDARHSFGTNMMKNGVNPKMVADMMRHNTVRTTLDNYSHTDKQMYKDTISLYNIQVK